MTNELFQRILERRLEKIEKTLSEKAREYASETNKFYNFDKGSEITGKPPKEVLWGFAVKHLVSVCDIVDDDSDTIDICKINEKIGDLINYLILLEILLKRDLIDKSQEKSEVGLTVEI